MEDFSYKQKRAAYKSSEPFFQSIKMTWKLIRWLFLISAVLHVALLLLLAEVSAKFRLIDFYYLFAFYVSKYIPIFSLPMHSSSGWSFATCKTIYTFLLPYENDIKMAVLPYYFISLLPFTFMVVGFTWFKRRANKMYQNTHLRGARLISEKDLNDAIYDDGLNAEIYISDKVLIPQKYETHHIVLLGKPGTGKTVVISSLIEQVLKRNDKAIIIDSKADFISYFYRHDYDVLMNPFDVRGLKINLLEEIEDVTEIDEICNIIIPDAGDNKDPFWVNSSRGLLNAILKYCYANNLKDNKSVYAACSEEREKLYIMAKKVQNHNAANTIKENNNTASSIIQVFRSYIRVLEYMSLGEKTFSLRDWVNDDNNRTSIFIPNYAKISAALRPIITVFYYLASNHILSLGDNRERRIWMFTDEFSRLDKIGAMHDILSNARSKGGCYVLGAQSLEKIMSTYGEKEGRSLLDNIGNTLIFNLPDEKAAEYGASRFGKKEFMDVTESLSMGSRDVRDGATLSEQRKQEYIIFPAEIQYLKDLNYYLKFPAYYPCTTKITPKTYVVKNEGFIKRDEIILDKIYSSFTQDDDADEHKASDAGNVLDNHKSKLAQKKPVPDVSADLKDVVIRADLNTHFKDQKTASESELAFVDNVEAQQEDKHDKDLSVLSVHDIFNQR